MPHRLYQVQHGERGGGRRHAPRPRAAASGPALPPRVALTPATIAALQRDAGNAAVATLINRAESSRPAAPVAAPVPGGVTLQRQFEDGGQTGEAELGQAGGEIVQPDLGEGGGGGGAPVASGTNEFGEMDGEIDTGVEVHAFTNKGKTGSSQWHHAGGNGGKGNENTGSSTTVAPTYDSAPPKKAGGQATAWIRKDTGTVKVKRSYIGVPKGNNGTATWAGSGGGLVYIASSGVSRIAKHETGHIKETRKIHDANIKPLEKRISTYRGALHKSMKAATAPAAVAALQAHVNWNPSLTSFANADTAMNQPGGTFDTTDQAKADFYHDKGPKTVGGTNYGHFIEAP